MEKLYKYKFYNKNINITVHNWILNKTNFKKKRDQRLYSTNKNK